MTLSKLGLVAALRPADQVEVGAGQYHIGGHLNVGKTKHVDKLAGWKVVVTQSGKQTEFHSPSNFEAMNQNAQPE